MSGVRAAVVILGLAGAAFATALLIARAPCGTWRARAGGRCIERAWTASAGIGVETPGLELRGLGVDAAGRGIAVWRAATPDRSTIGIGEERAPGSWVKRDPAAHQRGQEAAPALACGPAGEALVTWLHVGVGEGVVTSERDARGVWRDPAEVFSFEAGAVEPTAAIAPTGEQALAWCQRDDQTVGIAVATRASPTATWERPSGRGDVVSPSILFANQPQIAMSKGGEAIVGWYQSEGGPLMAYMSERRAGSTTFSHAKASDHLSPAGAAIASDPIANVKPAIGPRGEAAVVWVQENGAGASLVYLATRDAGGTWTKPRDLADSFSSASGVARNARIAFASDGALFVVWSRGDATNSAIFGARRDPGGRWITTGRDPLRLSSGQVAYEPVLTAGPEGAVIGAWIEQEGPHDERIAVRRTGTDRADWLPIEWLTPTHGGHLAWLRAAVGPHDRTLVGWVSGLKSTRIMLATMEPR